MKYKWGNKRLRQETWGTTITTRIERLSKLGLLSITAIYLTGFLVQTLWLARFHVVSLSLFRAQNILAGLWTLGPLFLAPVSSSFAEWTYTLGRKLLNRDSGYHASLLARSITSMIIYVLCLTLFSFGCALTVLVLVPFTIQLGAEQFVTMPYKDLLVMTLITGITSALIAIFGEQLHHALGDLIDAPRGSNEERLRAAQSILRNGSVVVILFLGYVSLFVLFVFPRIPYALGGGKFPEIVFLLKASPETEPATPQTFLASARSKPYVLLLESGEEYIVRDRDGPDRWRTIHIPRNAIEGYEISYPRQHWEVDRTPQAATQVSVPATRDRP